LAVEVDSGDRQAEVVELGEVSGAEVLPPPWGVDRLPAELLEEQKHHPVDSQHRPWALVAHNLSPCLFKQEYPMALAATNGHQSESMLVPRSFVVHTKRNSSRRRNVSDQPATEDQCNFDLAHLRIRDTIRS